MRQVTHKTLKVVFVAAVAAALVIACDIGGGSGGGGGGGGPTSDFTQIAGSGTITLRILGASSAHNGEVLLYGASGAYFGQVERPGDVTTVTSDDMSLTIPDPTSGDFVFTGGDAVGFVGCTIDVDASYTPSDGDYFAGLSDVTINGDQTIELTYPGDFTQVSGSGTITIQVEGANADHNGASLMYGAAGIPFGQYERSGNNAVISSDPVVVTIPHPVSGDFVFTGGDTIAGVGAIIDVNANDRADDGDWYANRLNLTVSGDRTVIFEY